MTRKLCAVGMRNAVLRNYLKSLKLKLILGPIERLFKNVKLLKHINRTDVLYIAEVKKFMLVTDADAKLTSIISLDVEYFIAKSLWSHNGMQRPVALDFDPSEKRVYWSDVAQGLILSAFMNATSVKILVRCNVKTPDGLAVDVVGRNIYWTDTETKRIEVASLDGSRRKILVKEALDKPRAIVLDERNG